MVLTHLRDTLALVVVVGALATLLLGACGGEDAPEEVALATATPSETAASERASPSPEPEATQAVETAASRDGHFREGEPISRARGAAGGRHHSHADLNARNDGRG